MLILQYSEVSTRSLYSYFQHTNQIRRTERTKVSVSGIRKELRRCCISANVVTALTLMFETTTHGAAEPHFRAGVPRPTDKAA
jgi:nicotinamide riboside transporter PnuC